MGVVFRQKFDSQRPTLAQHTFQIGGWDPARKRKKREHAAPHYDADAVGVDAEQAATLPAKGVLRDFEHCREPRGSCEPDVERLRHTRSPPGIERCQC